MGERRCEACEFWCSPEEVLAIAKVRWPHIEHNEGDMGQCRIRSTDEYFPQRSKADWCGEFHPKQEKDGAS